MAGVSQLHAIVWVPLVAATVDFWLPKGRCGGRDSFYSKGQLRLWLLAFIETTHIKRVIYVESASLCVYRFIDAVVYTNVC